MKKREIEERLGVISDELESLDETTENVERIAELIDESEKLEAQLKTIERLEKVKLKKVAAAAAGSGPGTDLSENEKKDLRKFSYTKFIKESADKARGNGSLTGLELEMSQEAEREASGLNSELKGIGIPSMIINPNARAHSVGGDLGTTVDETKVGFIDSLRDSLVLTQLGAEFLTDLTSNIEMDRQLTDVAFTWAAENAASSETGMTSDLVSFTAKRLTGHSIVSNQLLRQSSYDVERRLRESMVYGAARGFELAAISGSGVAPVPEGILNKTGVNSIATGALSYGKIVDMETAVDNDNALMSRLGYLTNTNVKGQAKQTQVFSGTNGTPLMTGPNNEMNGYQTGITNYIPANTILFGNWASLVMAQWGGLDIIADPYTLAGNNQVKITLHLLGDVNVMHPESFSSFVIS